MGGSERDDSPLKGYLAKLRREFDWVTIQTFMPTGKR